MTGWGSSAPFDLATGADNAAAPCTVANHTDYSPDFSLGACEFGGVAPKKYRSGRNEDRWWPLPTTHHLLVAAC